MKLKIVTLILTAVLTVVAVTALTTYAHRVENNAKSNISEYVLKEYGENVAIFKDGKLVEVFDSVLVSSLPEYDKNQLKRGMNFQTMEQIYSIIEDFDG